MNGLCKSCTHRFQCLTGDVRDWEDCLITAASSSLLNSGRENAHIPTAFLKERAKAKKEEREKIRNYVKKRIEEMTVR